MWPFKKNKKTEDVLEIENIFNLGVIGIKDIIAPSALEISPNYIKFGEKLAKTFFIFSFPRYLSSVWLSPVINLDVPMDISLYVHPVDTGVILRQLRRKVTEVQAELSDREEKGLIRAPELEIAYNDLEELRDKLQSAQEKVFRLGIYLTVYGNTVDELKATENTLRSILESRLIYVKPATFRQKEGFLSTAPYELDQLMISTPMNTAPLSSSFPFTSFDLSSNEGILYGINRHNNSMVLFDRFTLENANSVVFGKAGGGKSYAVKLEILRYLMTGVDVIVLDPENEYQFLSEAIGGSFFKVSLTSPNHINPFDLPPAREDETPSDVLRSNIINIVGLVRIMLGGLTPEEDSIIDRAITETYASRDITPSSDFTKIIPPLLSDFESVLKNMEGAESLVRRVQKFTTGSYAGFFNQPTNVSMQGNLIVFGIRDMEEELRPMAMYIILKYIWNQVRTTLKKRILIVDEAWWLMQSEDGASFLFGTAKRARKYWLGVTTITQDVVDFMKSSYGQPIINNSSLQILMKQSEAAIETIAKTFNLTDEEKYLLTEGAVGEGLFFAGPKHVAIKVVASYTEDQIITTAPEQVAAIKKAKEELE